MKLNNKGFAISTILYGLLALLIMILMITFEIMRTGNNNNKDLSEQVIKYLEPDTTSTCRKARVAYNKCIGECVTEKTSFEDACK